MVKFNSECRKIKLKKSKKKLRGKSTRNPLQKNFCKILSTRLNEQQGIFLHQMWQEDNHKRQTGREREVTTAYLDVLTSYLPGGSEKKHGKPVRTADFPATIQNGHFLNINCAHCCWATIYNKKDLKFSR